MVGRLVMYAALVIALGIVVVSACTPPQQSGPSPTIAPTASASRPATASPGPTATSSPTPARPQPSPTLAPGSSPAAACQPLTGGNTNNQAQLVAVRIAHQTGFDRLVFEFGQSTAPGPFGMPAYTVAPANSLSGPSGMPVTIAGGALFGARFMNTSTQTPTGVPSYTGSPDLKPTTPLIKQVRIVEDFERVLVWGIGLDRLACPRLLELSSPMRVVLDFPTPP